MTTLPEFLRVLAFLIEEGEPIKPSVGHQLKMIADEIEKLLGENPLAYRYRRPKLLGENPLAYRYRRPKLLGENPLAYRYRRPKRMDRP